MTIPPKLPDILIKCEDCHEESNCHPPEMVAWSNKQHKWLCSECWSDYDTYDEDNDRDTSEVPLVYAKDALDDAQEMQRRMIAAATRKRLGV